MSFNSLIVVSIILSILLINVTAQNITIPTYSNASGEYYILSSYENSTIYPIKCSYGSTCHIINDVTVTTNLCPPELNGACYVKYGFYEVDATEATQLTLICSAQSSCHNMILWGSSLDTQIECTNASSCKYANFTFNHTKNVYLKCGFAQTGSRAYSDITACNSMNIEVRDSANINLECMHYDTCVDTRITLNEDYYDQITHTTFESNLTLHCDTNSASCNDITILGKANSVNMECKYRHSCQYSFINLQFVNSFQMNCHQYESCYGFNIRALNSENIDINCFYRSSCAGHPTIDISNSSVMNLLVNGSYNSGITIFADNLKDILNITCVSEGSCRYMEIYFRHYDPDHYSLPFIHGINETNASIYIHCIDDDSCEEMDIWTTIGSEDNIFIDCNQLSDTSCDQVEIHCFRENISVSEYICFNEAKDEVKSSQSCYEATVLEYTGNDLKWRCDEDSCCPEIVGQIYDLTPAPTKEPYSSDRDDDEDGFSWDEFGEGVLGLIGFCLYCSCMVVMVKWCASGDSGSYGGSAAVTKIVYSENKKMRYELPDGHMDKNVSERYLCTEAP